MRVCVMMYDSESLFLMEIKYSRKESTCVCLCLAIDELRRTWSTMRMVYAPECL